MPPRLGCADAEKDGSPSGMEASLDSLSITGEDKKRVRAGPVVDSWEDDEPPSSSTNSDSETGARPDAPPPTPISPSARTGAAWGEFPPMYSSPCGRSHVGGQPQSPSARPEKSTAAAGRMIAGALGVKAPTKSEEARAYERAIREKESKRISKERGERKTEEERRQRARRQIWED
ncbi:MAG: hypothetical protein L6R39_000128 [Caloplaca ligustica]|nr:MAG: hypothetical protein L6R39_000128 [Caloplaca ligustica]